MKVRILLCCVLFVCKGLAQPVFSGASFYGENYTACYEMHLELDNKKNLYAAGFFSGLVNFNPAASPVTFTTSGFFICKYGEFGNLIWAKNLKAQGNNKGIKKLLIDHEGNVLVYGFFDGSMDCDPGPVNNQINGGVPTQWNNYTPVCDLFLLKLDSSGNFKWVNQYGGDKFEKCGGMAVDPSDNIYISGAFPNNMDLDPGPAVFTASSGTLPASVFIEKLDKNGQIVWAGSMPGSTLNSIESIVVDKDKEICIGGRFSGNIDLDHGGGVTNFSAGQDENGFIAKYDTLGSLKWASQIGGKVLSLRTDKEGSLYSAGVFKNGDFDPGQGSFTMAAAGVQDIFINKINAGGNMVWTKQFAGNNSAQVTDMTIDDDKDLYLTGHFSDSCDFDPSIGNYILSYTHTSKPHVFLSRLDSSGNFKCAGGIYSANYGGTGGSVEVDKVGNIYMSAKLFDVSDVDMGAGTVQYGGPQYQGVVLAKYRCGSLTTAIETISTSKNDLMIYPNPALDNIFIKNVNSGSIVTIRIFNTAGELVVRERAVGSNSEIFVGMLKPGVYFVELTSEGKRSAHKVIKTD